MNFKYILAYFFATTKFHDNKRNPFIPGLVIGTVIIGVVGLVFIM